MSSVFRMGQRARQPGGDSSRDNPLQKRTRLPKLEPNANRRAQEIVERHLHTSSEETFVSSACTIPVLEQIASTAPDAGRSHDVSYLKDKKVALAPKVAPSLIRESDWVYESSFLPQGPGSVYNGEDGMWRTLLFPSDKPSSRTDAVLLDAWITRAMTECGQSAPKSPQAGGGDLATRVEELVPLLSIGLHEVVRQVTHHCPERGLALEKIWKTYVDLFDRVLSEMQAALRLHKEKASGVQLVLKGAQSDLDEQKSSHPQQMQQVIVDLEAQFSAAQAEVEATLRKCDQENVSLRQELRKHHAALELWYPSFTLYQNSYMKGHIPSSSGVSAEMRNSHLASKNPDGEPGNMPEMAIAEDFKRLLSAFTPDKRKAIGKELSSIFAGVSSASSGQRQVTAEKGTADQDETRIAVLQAEISAQEEIIEQLKQQVESLESGRSLPDKRRDSAPADAAEDATAAALAARAPAPATGPAQAHPDVEEG